MASTNYRGAAVNEECVVISKQEYQDYLAYCNSRKRTVLSTVDTNQLAPSRQRLGSDLFAESTATRSAYIRSLYIVSKPVNNPYKVAAGQATPATSSLSETPSTSSHIRRLYNRRDPFSTTSSLTTRDSVSTYFTSADGKFGQAYQSSSTPVLSSGFTLQGNSLNFSAYDDMRTRASARDKRPEDTATGVRQHEST